MEDNKKEIAKSLEILMKEDIHTWEQGEGMIVATIHPADSEPKDFKFPEGKSSVEIVQHSTSASNVQIPPEDEKRIAHMLDDVREFKKEWEFSLELAGFSLGPDSPLFFPLKLRFSKKSEGKK